MPDFGPARGYGDLLWRGLSAAQCEVVVTLDPAQDDNVVERVCGLLGPLMERGDLSMVKGFRSPPDVLSELLARPLINLHHPKLAGLAEPLSGDVAARKQLLRTLHFPVGSGVNISLLLDAAEAAGFESIAQTYLAGDPDNTSLTDSEKAYAILAAAASRTSHVGEKDLIPSPLFLPGPENLDSRRVPVEERPPLRNVPVRTPTRVPAGEG